MDRGTEKCPSLYGFKSIFVLIMLLLANFASYIHFVNFRPETPKQLLPLGPFLVTYIVYMFFEGVLAPSITIILVENILKYSKTKFWASVDLLHSCLIRRNKIAHLNI